MALKEDLKNKIDSFFEEKYEVEETTIVPDTDYSKLTFGNKGLTCDFAFLFIDIRKSSQLHTTYGVATAARIYQSFHEICVRIINLFNGQIRSFDGDRVMGVFAGGSKCSNATKSAMKIRWAVNEYLCKHLKTPIKIGCGIEYGKTLVTKVGKGRNDNNFDLVWVGQACNYAAHLSGYGSNKIIISKKTYNKIADYVKWKDESTKETNMWTSKKLIIKGGKEIDIYESTYHWEL